MKRAFAVLIVPWLLLVCFALNFSARSGLAEAATANRETARFRIQPSVTIVFRGLMVFHPDPAREYLEVGIVSAPEHEFRVQVIEDSPEGVSSFFVRLGQLENSKSEVWWLESTSSNKKQVSFYENGSFDRKSDVGDKRDFRWIVDLGGKEFYDRSLQTDPGQLGLMLHVTGGEFYTRKRTPALMRKKGDDAFQYFGMAAQEVATDVSLEGGDLVLKSGNPETEILRLKQKPDTTYEIVVENVPTPQGHMTVNANHFEYYYKLLAIPRAEWYDFGLSRTAISSSAQSTSASFTFASFGATSIHPERSVPNDPDARCLPILW